MAAFRPHDPRPATPAPDLEMRAPDASQHPAPLSGKMAAFGTTGGGGGGLKRLFMTHPPLEERVTALHTANQ